MLTLTHPPASSTRIDGQALRATLTALWEESSGEASELRRLCVPILRGALDAARKAIIGSLDHSRAGHGAAKALAQATDEVVAVLWDFTTTHVYRARNPTEGERLALLAVGGYGRGELAPSSDLDLLFLRTWKETPHSESVIEFILYTLWDLGLKVGHASRTVDDTLRQARHDHTIMTAVLENHRIAGDVRLCKELTDRLATETRSGAHDFIGAKLAERDQRHLKAGATRFMVEPNVKEGKGGLRDLHTLFWIARYLEGSAGARTAPVLDVLLTEKERQIFRKAFDFLWKVRIVMHDAAGRAEDRLSFDLQPEVAQRMGFVDRMGEPNVERFMRRYFITAKEVGALTRAFATKLEEQQAAPLTRLSHLIQSGLKSFGQTDLPGFVISGGRLNVQDGNLFRKSPVAMFRMFKIADRLDLELHPDAFTAISRNLNLVKTNLRRDPTAAKIFLDLLVNGKDPYRTLGMMSETGLLGRYIPEFGRINAQTQFNMYHAYTVDEHTLRAIDVIHGIDNGRYRDDHPLASTLIPHLQDKESLYFAMLLHDVGKGGEGGQEVAGEIAARKACARLGLESWQIEQVAWLVRHHLVLSDFAQKRDVSDPETVAAFAEIVQTPERLRLLLILTVADIRAVGPGVWNAWKGQLMRDLFAATEAVFRGGRESDVVSQVREDLRHRAEMLRTVMIGKDASVAPWLATMDDSYVFAFTPDDIRHHAALFTQVGEGAPVVEARVSTDRNATAFLISAKDRPGLFADLARAFANLGANVVGAQVFTSTSGRAVDLFHVQDTQGQPFGRDDPKRLKAFEALVAMAAKGQVPDREDYRSQTARAAAFAIAPTVNFDDNSTSHATIIEVSGRDRPGLLADLVESISKARLDISSAHIDCYGERAVDAFYVTGTANKAQLSGVQKQSLRKRLLAVLGDTPPPSRRNLAQARASTAR